MKNRSLALTLLMFSISGVAIQAAASETEAIGIEGAQALDTVVEENENWKRTTTTTDNGTTTVVTESKTGGGSRTKTSGSDGHGSTTYYDSDGNQNGPVVEH